MLRAAAIANKSRQITGCIILHQGEFLHFLEGEKVNVLSLFAKISNDNRHEHTAILHAAESNTFAFKSNFIVSDLLLNEKNLSGHQVMSTAEFKIFKQQYQQSEIAVRFFITLADSLLEKGGQLL